MNKAGTTAGGARDRSATTVEKVRFLASPAAYPGGAGPVEVQETHLSWVFLVGDRVYKLKKPARYPHLDFTTLAAREANCREEVRLNRRLAPDVYLGVRPLTLAAGRRLAIGGDGEVVDWLVEMRRLPAARMLDRAIVDDTVAADSVALVARRLAEFYRQAPPTGLGPADYVGQFASEHAISRDVLTRPGFDLDRRPLDRALGRVEETLDGHPGLLHRRVETGRIVEGHGDLRPEHICLVEPPAIIDCLEFSRRLRLVDPLDELLFLTLECDRLGARWVGEMVLDHYLGESGDQPEDRLVAFYWAYRACLRARMSLAHLLEPETRTPEKWLPLARRYVELALAPISLNRRPAR